MNPNSLLALSEQFQKSAKFKDPFRNSEHDIEEALDYCSDFFKIKNLTEERSLINLPLEWLDIQKIPNFLKIKLKLKVFGIYNFYLDFLNSLF